jgi:hypothetical protein
MKKITKLLLVSILSLLLIGECLSAVEEIEFDRLPSVRFEEMMAKNNIFLKWCSSYDIEGDYIYFADQNFATIFKVRLADGKLDRTISRKGQGPSELTQPTYIRVRNGMIFVLDVGFNGIKVFDTNGKTIKEIKLTIPLMSSTLDVTKNNEIYIGKLDFKERTLVSVYNIKGEKLRSLAKIESKDKIDRVSNLCWFTIKLDKDENIYALHYLLRKISKYDREGQLLWTSDIDNKLINKVKREDTVKRGSKNTVKWRRSIFGLDFTPKNDILIGHSYGGCIMSSRDGKLKNLIIRKESPLKYVNIVDDTLYNMATFGRAVEIVNLKNMEKMK